MGIRVYLEIYDKKMRIRLFWKVTYGFQAYMGSIYTHMCRFCTCKHVHRQGDAGRLMHFHPSEQLGTGQSASEIAQATRPHPQGSREHNHLPVICVMPNFPFAILRIDCLSMHFAASAQQNKRLTLRDAFKLSQHAGGVNNIIMCRCLFIV